MCNDVAVPLWTLSYKGRFRCASSSRAVLAISTDAVALRFRLDDGTSPSIAQLAVTYKAFDDRSTQSEQFGVIFANPQASLQAQRNDLIPLRWTARASTTMNQLSSRQYNYISLI